MPVRICKNVNRDKKPTGKVKRRRGEEATVCVKANIFVICNIIYLFISIISVMNVMKSTK